MKKLTLIIVLIISFFSFDTPLKGITNISINSNKIIPDFSKNTKEYNVFVNNKTEIIKIIVESEEGEIITGDGSKSLKKGLNILEIISYENEQEKEKYTLNIVRGEINYNENEALLDKLHIANHEIDFQSDKFTYKINANNNEKSLDLSYETLNPLTTVKVVGDLNLNNETNIIKLEVTSENKKNTNTYTIKVKKEIPEKIIEKKHSIFDTKDFSSFELKLIRIGIIAGCLIFLTIIFYFLFIKTRTINIVLDTSHNILRKLFPRS